MFGCLIFEASTVSITPVSSQQCVRVEDTLLPYQGPSVLPYMWKAKPFC